MSSLLTNTSAMVALQTLRSINTNLARTQGEISTGKSIASAKDNAAIWAISKTMESDVSGFKAISSSLALGQSTLGTARAAAEQITDLLIEVKDKIVAAQEENQDRAKIQTDLAVRRDQIASIVGAAQFSGLNMLSNRKGGATVAQIVAGTGPGAGVLGSGTVSFLSSLDRQSNGTVTASHIDAGRADLGTQARVAGTGTDLAASAMTVSGAATANGGTSTITIVGQSTTTRGNNLILAGDTYTLAGLTNVTGTVSYVARDGDTLNDIAQHLGMRLNFEAEKSGVALSASVTGAAITLTNRTAADVTATVTTGSGGTAGGGLAILGEIDVTTEKGAKAALAVIEGLIQTAVQASSDFGSAQGRIEIQQKFVGGLIDSLRTGIGSLVDADMEAASARLQALQVQQQLGIQALSIANQAPQNILALFR